MAYRLPKRYLKIFTWEDGKAFIERLILDKGSVKNLRDQSVEEGCY